MSLILSDIARDVAVQHFPLFQSAVSKIPFFLVQYTAANIMCFFSPYLKQMDVEYFFVFASQTRSKSNKHVHWFTL